VQFPLIVGKSSTFGKCRRLEIPFEKQLYLLYIAYIIYNDRCFMLTETATVSSKGWIVIPVEYRRKYDIGSGDVLKIIDYGGILSMVPVSKNPVKEAFGIFKGKVSLCTLLTVERDKERIRENAKKIRH
jgi:AbrB family looped-hinge helix DNA binding protein